MIDSDMNLRASRPREFGLRQKLAIIDTETTGIYRTRDKIIEIAIICADQDGNIEEEYSTLINPSRDLGNTNIHGIKAAEVIDAPSFSDVAGDVLSRLENRIIVGHNIGSDLGMLTNHFDMMNSSLPAPPNVCTLRLAYEYGPSCRRLAECCSYFGISHHAAHNALEDARVTLKLLLKYLRLAKSNGYAELTQLPAYRQGEGTDWPKFQTTGKRLLRNPGAKTKVLKRFPGELIAKLPQAGSAELASYFLLLDRVLEDRKLTDDEISELSAAALDSGISSHDIWKAHREYVYGLVKVALEDGRVTDAEVADIQHVASMLGFEAQFVCNVIDRFKAGELTATLTAGPKDLAGLRVCFTGTLTLRINGVVITRERAHELAALHGLIPVNSITRKTDVLVVADTDTMSGKAKKAKEYGKRVIVDRNFFNLLQVPVD